MGNKLQISITGPTKSGKTTVAQKVVDCLRENGFDVNWNVEDEVRKIGMNWLNALDAVSESTTITVIEKTVKTDINESLNYRVKKQ